MKQDVSGMHYLSMVLGRWGFSVKDGKRLNHVLQFAGLPMLLVVKKLPV